MRDFLLAMKSIKKKVAAELQLRSDQGFQYTTQAYFNLTKEYGMAENSFGILKAERIYRHQPASFAEASRRIDDHIYF